MLQQIIDQIQDTIRPEVAQWETDTFHYIKKLERYCINDVYDEAKTKGLKGAVEVYKLKVAAGWSPSLDRFFRRPEKDLKAMIAKEAQAKLTKIDVAVKKLLKDVNVEQVEARRFTMHSNNAFCEGSWKINGDKILAFRAIYAGGYNIQTLHIRTIFSYK